jgi:hypothetical protein
MVDNTNSVLVELGEIENICFVLMPFDSLFQTQYERVIRPAVEELGLKCIRGDEIYSKPNIMSDVWKSIRKSRLIIAELTNRNANVFYEIGLAHAIGKPIILLTRNEDDVPFDLKSLRYRYYDVNDPFWGENLRDAIQSMIRNVVEQKSFATYLDGISIDVTVPAPPKKVDVERYEELVPINISGNWKATWKGGLAGEHQAVIYITQEGEQLSATMTVSFLREDKMTVIQEILIGSIQGKRVSLNGVSYTYIQQGTSPFYNLDNFTMEMNSDKNRMEGLYYDPEQRGEIIITKLQDNS